MRVFIDLNQKMEKVVSNRGIFRLRWVKGVYEISPESWCHTYLCIINYLQGMMTNG
ncbi:MAG: hypothetical protein ACTSV5_10235 [Promethearchaeota archaeon]